jgi:4-amino-4-deoxy-L-arabinose transferase-like glycosyltransferase
MIREGTKPAWWMTWRAPLLVAAVSLCVRLGAIFALHGTLYWDNLLWDEEYYHQWASEIAGGGSRFSDVYKAAPAPAYLFAAAYAVAGPSPHAIRALSLAAGTGLCVLLYFLAARLFDRRAALLAGAIAALYGPLLLFSAVPLKEIWSALALAGVCWALAAAWDKPFWPRHALLGALAGLTAVTRPNALALVPILGIAAFLSRFHGPRTAPRALAAAAAFTAGCAVALAPFLIRNAAVSGEAVIATSQAGFNFRIANDPDDPYPFFRPSPHASGSPFEEGIQFTIEASRRAGRRLSTSEASRFWLDATLADAARRPLAFASRFAEKLAVLLSASETSDHYDLRFLAALQPFFRVPWLGFAAILPLAVVGAAVSWRDRRVRAIALVAAAYGATLVVFFTTDRYRAALAAMLIPLAARGALALFDLARERRPKRLAILVFGALLVAAAQRIPYRGEGDLTAMWNGYAFFLQRAGRTDEAVAYWTRSAGADGPFSDYARQSLASVALDRGDAVLARRWLVPIRDDSAVAALKHELLGDLAAHAGDAASATAEYERSVAINSGRESPWVKLVRLYASRDREKALAAHARLLEVRSYYK